MLSISRPLRTRGLAPLLALAAWSCGGDATPVQLTYRLDASPGASFVTSLTHDLAIDMGDHGSEGVRAIRLGYTMQGEETGPAAGMVTVDSVRASIVWGQMQQRVDARHLVGRYFGISVTDGNGPASYDDEQMPTIDMGPRGGGRVPASFLVDYAFPTLPDGPVAVGSTWSATRTSLRLQGVIWVTGEVRTTYRVTGTEEVEGRDCVRVQSESTGTLSGGSAGDLPLDYAGQLTGTASWCFDAESGVLLEMTGEETAEGSTPWPNGATATMDQTTRVDVRTVLGSAS